MFSMFVICSALLLLSIKYSNEHKTKPPVVILANICYSSLMKKIITTATVLAVVVSFGAGAYVVSQNHVVELIKPSASVIRPTHTDNTPQTSATPTATAPARTTTSVTAQTATTDAPTSVPVTVTAYEQIPLDSDGTMDCKLTYSDATTYQWHWQTITQQGTWMTDGQGANGHWVAATNNFGTCNQSVIGTTKS
jgi:hypothetical protein